MSADNGVYILQTGKEKKEFRVRLLFAVENIYWDDENEEYSSDGKVQIKNAREMWVNCTVFDNEEDAQKEAIKIYKDIGYTEYGISTIAIDEDF
jgi:hypothetical protein